MKILNLVTTTIIIFSLIIVQGCATMLQSGPDMIVVNSKPKGAHVLLDNLPVGSTPITVAVGRSSECIIQIEKEGYKTVIVDQDKVLAGWFFPGNLLWLLIWPAFPVAMTVDLASSNQGKYPTTALNVDLVKESDEESKPSDQEEEKAIVTEGVAEKLRELKELRDSDILTEEEYETRRKALVDNL